MARVKRERDRFVGFVVRGVESIPADDRVRGYARFAGPHTLEVGDDTRVTFGRAVIATGSSPAVPPFLRALGDRVLVNDDVFEWDTLPRAVAVFGPGVIGLELGQALARLGVQVRMFGVGGLVGPFSDPAVREYATRTFGAEFFLDADARVTGVARTADGAIVRYRDRQGAEAVFTADYVIAATGRTPNVRGLAPERAGIELDARGVPVYDPRTLQCGASHVFIAGDANADLPLLHEAADEGRIAGDNAARFPKVSPSARRTPLAVVFSDPQLAVVGKRHADLRPGTFVTGAVSFEDQGRSRVMLRNRGLLHLYAELGTGRLLGAEMIGPDAEHIAHLLAWVVQLGLTVPQILSLPFYHPVVEEGLRTALRDANERLAAAADGLRTAA
jgi:dihydrolipoamide dehydrogenase